MNMVRAGIDVTVFKPHSTRAAASAAKEKDIPLETIMKAAGWSSAKTFSSFYDKPIVSDSKVSLTNAILQ